MTTTEAYLRGKRRSGASTQGRANRGAQSEAVEEGNENEDESR